MSADTLAAVLDQGLARMPDGAGGVLAAALDADARARLLRFVALLHKWNRVYNLTAVRDPREMIARHLLDSLTLLPWLPPPRAEPCVDGIDDAVGDTASDTVRAAEVDLLDIGSGAGLPSIPLAIARPDLRILSVDTNGKKTRFQQQAKLELALSGLTIRQARIETLTESGSVVRARCVTARAFTDPAAFLNLAAPFCRQGGYALMMLGQREAADALPAGGTAGFGPVTVHPVTVPGIDGARHLAICDRC